MLQPTSTDTIAPNESTKLSAITVDEGKKSSVKRETYSYEQVVGEALEYFQGDELAAKTWVSKYALQEGSGLYVEKTPTDMHWRLAREFARIEAKYPNPMSEEEIFKLFDQQTV